MVVSLLIAVGTRAQWTTNGSNIYNSNSGAVGIGIITPQEKLHVEGNFYLNTGSFIIDQTASTDAKFYFKNVGNYEWDLGMETSDPTHNFYLYNRSNATYPITISKANVPTFKSDKIRLEGMASGGGINIWDIECRDIIDNDFGICNASQSAYRLDINNLGNVGIGTTTPLEKLHVNGRFYINSGTDYNNIYWGGHFMTMGTRPGDYSHNIFRLQPGGSSSGLLESVFEMFNANNVNSYTQTVQIRSNDISYFNGGNVGIGTATPDFSVNYFKTVSTDRLGFVDGGGVERMSILNGGNVGIGTAAPSTKLHVNGAIRVESASGGVVGSGTGSRIELSTGNGTNIEENWGINLIGNDASPVKIRNASLLVGYTTNSAGWGTGGNLLVQGNVGIGTTAPQAPFHAAGTCFLGTAGNEFYISSGTTFFGTKAGIRNNGGDVVFNSRNGGTVYLNRDITADVRIQSFNSTTSSNLDIATFLQSGNVGIGTATPDAKLAVKGQIHAQEVKVDLTGSMAGPDYVFEKNYKLPTLEEIKAFIDQNKHLPGVPSAPEMEKNGVQLGEMNMLLLKKMEELTLYAIEMNKNVKELKKMNEDQQNEIEELRNKIK